MKRPPFLPQTIGGAYPVLAAVSSSYPEQEGRLSTRYSPVRHSTREPKPPFAFDLHVLSTPPAFNLSQNQTLQFDKTLNTHVTMSFTQSLVPISLFTCQ